MSSVNGIKKGNGNSFIFKLNKDYQDFDIFRCKNKEFEVAHHPNWMS